MCPLLSRVSYSARCFEVLFLPLSGSWLRFGCEEQFLVRVCHTLSLSFSQVFPWGPAATLWVGQLGL